uniref:S4 RNA-binding domain-containing protein n=1 Tax=Rhabditophanes sp. KR3021 TaxID=114890 RepID=A0AC35TFN8_9BILA
MVRKLKFHEQKLLKKVDFIDWSLDNNLHESQVMAKYGIQKRAHYLLYNKLSRKIRDFANNLKEMNDANPIKMEMIRKFLGKLYQSGLIQSADSLERANKVTATCFARRRLPVMMKNSNMTENIKLANDYVEQGHVRVGTELVTDPAFLVNRDLSDYITWTRGSKIKRHIDNYNGERDDYTTGI